MIKKGIIILNKKEFEGVINCPDKVKRVMNDLENSPEIKHGVVLGSYSDEGYACFEIIMNKPDKLVLSFTGTAA